MASRTVAWNREEHGLGWWAKKGGPASADSTPADAPPVETLYAAKPAADATDVAVLVNTYASVVFRVAHAVLHSRTEAEDVVQETFLRVMRHGDFAEVRDMRVWLVRIAWRLALDRKRKLRPDQMDRGFAENLVARDAPADIALAEAERFARVMRAMDRLPRGEREVLALAATEEMSTAEMAAVLGRSESAVRALLFRARTRLKERLGKEARR